MITEAGRVANDSRLEGGLRRDGRRLSEIDARTSVTGKKWTNKLVLDGGK